MSEELRRQLQQRVESLRLAGVEFLPRTDGLPAGFNIAPEERSNPLPAHPMPAPVATEPAPIEKNVPRDEPAPIPVKQAAPEGAESRRTELQLLAKQVAQCMRCPELASTRTQTVFGVGPLDPELCFIGEAPGADEDRKGEPFVGAAGQLLDRIIAGMGMKRSEVYICNILRCRPPGNRTPKSDEAKNCREWLDQTLSIVRPRYICCLGGSAAKNLLGINLSVGAMRKKFYEYDGIPVICTFHPSYLLRIDEPEAQKKAKGEVWDDMKMLLAKMGRAVPTGAK
jgi:uracil-DNA glycosylase